MNKASEEEKNVEPEKKAGFFQKFKNIGKSEKPKEAPMSINVI